MSQDTDHTSILTQHNIVLSKKSEKKWLRSRAKLIKDKLQITNVKTNLIVIANAGLGNGVTREELVDVLAKNNLDNFSVFQPPLKSYALIKFESDKTAQTAFKCIMGYCLKSDTNLTTPSATFYTHYLTNIPQLKAMEKDFVVMQGLFIIENFLTEKEEFEMINFLNEESKILCNDKNNLKNRQVWHYGYEFVYGTNDVDLNKPLKIPSEILQLIEKLYEKNYIKRKPNQITVNKYLPGHGIPSHIDNPEAFEEDLVSLSLKSSTVMEFKHPSGAHEDIFIKPRTLLVMQGDARYVWSHGISSRKVDIVPSDIDGELTSVNRGERISITFRKVKDNFVRTVIDMPKIKNLPTNQNEAHLMEEIHVNNVYNEIANHFSCTREKPWPKVEKFLNSLETSSLVLDVGCGSGRYLGIRNDICMIGCDKSENLIQICGNRGQKVFICDGLNISVRKESLDACICIAVIHHYSTETRRKEAVLQLLQCLRSGGKILVYVWALEQELKRIKSKYLKEVSDELKQNEDPKLNKDGNINSSCDSDIVIHKNRTKFKQQDLYVPWHRKVTNESDTLNDNDQSKEKVFHRFYHVFKEGELLKIFQEIENVQVLDSYYDDGNWCILAEKA